MGQDEVGKDGGHQGKCVDVVGQRNQVRRIAGQNVVLNYGSTWGGQ